MMAALMATVAFSVDAMLPVLPVLVDTYSPDAPNLVQLVVTVFVFGMGIGTLFTGPLSDAFGRKPIIIAGAVIYMVSAFVAAHANSLEVLLIARFCQGLGAAGPRVVALATVRDLYSGSNMARVMSFVMMIFTLIPALAPSLGAVLVHLGGWRAIFYAFIVFSATSSLWLWTRLPETLPRENRRAFRVPELRNALIELLSHPTVRTTLMVQSLCFGALFGMITSIQQIYDQSFDRADSFPIFFGAIAVLAISGSALNARLVGRLGMRRLSTMMLTAQLGFSGIMVVLMLSGLSGMPLFLVFLVWQFTLFFQNGLTIGNLNAIAMEPMGHIAGMAASILGAISTVLAVILAAPIGLSFDGTPLPLAIGIFVYMGGAVLLMRRLNRAGGLALA